MKKTMPLPSYVKSAIRKLNQAGYEAYVVGGAVRSWLLGMDTIHDYDVTTSALPAEIKEVFADSRIIDTGIRHGTVTLIDHKNTLEITTYRTESGYSDHRHPDSVAFTRSLEEDCARRDFTINALCYHPKEGILDFFGGRQDLQNFLIRAVNDPYLRFEEDALRILRALRFAAQLGFVIEDVTREALLAKVDGLNYISQERITSELIKTIGAPYFRGILEEYRSIFERLIPELGEYDDACHAVILQHISGSPSDPGIRMAVLLNELHDPARVDEILRRLKYSNADRYAILNLLECASLPLKTRIDMRKAISQLTVPPASYISFRCACDSSLDRNQLEELWAAICRDGDCCSLKQLDINGRDLKELGLKSNQISMSMNMCLNAVMADQVPNTKQELIAYLRSFMS